MEYTKFCHCRKCNPNQKNIALTIIPFIRSEHMLMTMA